MMIESSWAQKMPVMPDLPILEMHLVGAIRLSVLAHKTRHDVTEIMTRKIGSAHLANRLSILLAAIGDVWVDAFHVARPCCGYLTLDEALLVQIVRLAGAGNRPEYDRLLCEMLSEEERDMLFVVVGSFCRCWFPQVETRYMPTTTKRIS